MKDQLYSAIKWTWVIAVAATAYYVVAPNVTPHYYFVKKDQAVFRGNTINGQCERLAYAEDSTKGSYEWLNVTE